MKLSQQRKNLGNRLTWLLLALICIAAGWTVTVSATQGTPAEQFAQETPDTPAGEPSPASVEAVASDPDFSTIDDPLNGDYVLYTVDDLVISRSEAQNSSAVNGYEYNYILKTANSSIASQEQSQVSVMNCYVTASGNRNPQMTRVGRLWELPSDVIVTLGASDNAQGSTCQAPFPSTEASLLLTVTDSSGNNHRAGVTSTDQNGNTVYPAGLNTAVAMGDFTQDNYQDLVIMTNAGMLVATAKDVNDFSQGIKFGPFTPMPKGGLAAAADPVSGDFNGDGLPDLAWIGGGIVHYATVCPGGEAAAGSLCAGKKPLTVLIDPLNSQATQHGPVAGSCRHSVMALAAGNFSGTFNDDLVILDCQNSDEIHARWFMYNADMSVVNGAAFASKVLWDGFYSPSDVYAQTVNLDWFGAKDQVAFAVGAATDVSGLCGQRPEIMQEKVGVITFQDNAMTSADSTGRQSSDCNSSINPSNPPAWVDGLAAGYFAAFDIGSSAAPSRQLATMLNDGHVRIYTVDPSSGFKPALASETPLDFPKFNFRCCSNDANRLNWLSAGDYQGRSVRLGPPSIVEVASQSQASIILSAPPMHVDYILPAVATGSDWEVVNLSALPGNDNYSSSFTMSATSTNQSSDTNTTSYTYATTVKEGAKFSLAGPFEGTSTSLTHSATQKKESVNETYTFTQNEFKYDASTTTGWGDEIWTDEASYYLYMYPVIGETVCPDSIPTCTPDQEQPLYLTFSGPSSSGTGPAPGSTTEWYQPIQEPGNIFSYPWSLAMLQQQLPDRVDPTPLSKPEFYYTDTSGSEVTVDWSTVNQKDETTGVTNTFSSETAFSQSVGGKGAIVEGGAEFSLDVSGSTAISNLNKSSSSLGASMGIAIHRTGNFRVPPLYTYRVEPYIFGRQEPANYLDNLDLTEPNTTFGPLQTAYVVNPKDSNAGSWWSTSPYTKDFDVALNHPVRWNPTTGGDGLNCITSVYPAVCLEFNPPYLDDLWNSEFHWMRGLQVTVNSDQGPQRIDAVAGDEVFLQARVYNYSFKNMPAGSEIQVRFYRQQIDPQTKDLLGNSVLIQQVSAAPLPGFGSQSGAPNYSIVGTSMDTSALGGTYQYFWVLVWVEDSAGNMISELPGHGLSAKPGSLATIADVPLEEVTLDGVTSTFSNNVGYLHQVFYIASEVTTAPPTADPVLSINNVQISPATPEPGERVIVSADIFSIGSPAEAVHVRLFPSVAEWQAHRADPAQLQPKPFDVELLPFIAGGESDRLEVPYQTNACGKQEVLIVARSAATDDVTTATTTFDNGPCMVYYPVMPIQSYK